MFLECKNFLKLYMNLVVSEIIKVLFLDWFLDTHVLPSAPLVKSLRSGASTVKFLPIIKKNYLCPFVYKTLKKKMVCRVQVSNL